jgi:hypothetical protein
MFILLIAFLFIFIFIFFAIIPYSKTKSFERFLNQDCKNASLLVPLPQLSEREKCAVLFADKEGETFVCRKEIKNNYYGKGFCLGVAKGSTDYCIGHYPSFDEKNIDNSLYPIKGCVEGVAFESKEATDCLALISIYQKLKISEQLKPLILSTGVEDTASCITNMAAVPKNDTAACDQIKPILSPINPAQQYQHQVRFEKCLASVAGAKKDPSICARIDDVSTKSFCVNVSA